MADKFTLPRMGSVKGRADCVTVERCRTNLRNSLGLVRKARTMFAKFPNVATQRKRMERTLAAVAVSRKLLFVRLYVAKAPRKAINGAARSYRKAWKAWQTFYTKALGTGRRVG